MNCGIPVGLCQHKIKRNFKAELECKPKQYRTAEGKA